MGKWLRIFFLVLPIWCFSDPNAFALHMGKETPAWQYCKTKEDRSRYAFFESLFQKNCARRMCDQHKVPNKLHFIWLGSAPIPDDVRGRMEKWMDLHPDWQYVLWSDVEREIPGVVCAPPPEDLVDAYFETADLDTKQAILSFEILHREGGLYVHSQATPFASFAAACRTYPFFCGLQPLGKTVYSSSIMPATHLIGASAGHPILKRTLELLTLDPTLAFAQGVDDGIGEEDIVFPAAFVSGAKRKAVSLSAFLPKIKQDFSPSEQRIDRTLVEILKKEKQETTVLLSMLGISFLPLMFLAVYARRVLPLLLLLPLGLEGSDTFYKEMGQGTPHWKYVLDVEEIAHFAQLFEKNWGRGEGDYRIPKVIHFIWLGPSDFPSSSVENVRDFLAHHPDWTVKFWTDRKRLPPCNDMEVCLVDAFSFSQLKECYELSQNWGERSDILRFEILAQEGGLYVDHDASCLQSFDSLHKGHDFYCGLEVPHPPVAGKTITAGNGIIGSKAGHPILLRVITEIKDNWESLGKKYRGADGYSRTQLVMERTYIRLTEALDQLQGDDIVLPASYFFAKQGLKPVFSAHQFANSWAVSRSESAEFKRQTNAVCKQFKKRKAWMRWGAIGALCLNLILQAGIFLRLRTNIQRRT